MSCRGQQYEFPFANSKPSPEMNASLIFGKKRGWFCPLSCFFVFGCVRMWSENDIQDSPSNPENSLILWGFAVFVNRPCLALVHCCFGGGLAAFQKFSLPSTNTSKTLYLQCLDSFQVPFSASSCGKCFSPHFPQTENGRGFDSLRHIKRGEYAIPISCLTCFSAWGTFLHHEQEAKPQAG